MNNYIFVFDDLERCDCPINEVFGLINGLVEHEGTKVILVANEKEISQGVDDSNEALEYYAMSQIHVVPGQRKQFAWTYASARVDAEQDDSPDMGRSRAEQSRQFRNRWRRSSPVFPFGNRPSFDLFRKESLAPSPVHDRAQQRDSSVDRGLRLACLFLD